MLTLLALLFTGLLVQLSQRLLPLPLQPVKKRAWPSCLLTLCMTSTAFLILHVLTQRPLLSAALTCSLFWVLLVINNAKYRALREPLLFSDAYLYIQVLRHPRLFLPFLNLPLTSAACALALLAIYGLIAFEPPLEQQWLLPSSSPALLVVFSGYGQIGLLAVFLGWGYHGAQKATLTFHPISDVQQYGLVGSLLSYAVQAYSRKRQAHYRSQLTQQAPFALLPPLPSLPYSAPHLKSNRSTHSAHQWPDLLVIQSESFFDARRLYPAIHPQLFRHFDGIKQQSLQQGLLQVPAWGANTLRSEFGFLTGLSPAPLEHFQFHPYAYLPTVDTTGTTGSQRFIPSLPAYLSYLGYECVCIHPNDSRFFGRQRIFPQLGFERFIDGAHFQQAEKAGAYVSDKALTEYVMAFLEQRSHSDDTSGLRPLFLFVITMENHGPLHWETCDPASLQTLYPHAPPPKHHDLSVYLNHLQHADEMIIRLQQQLQQRSTPSVLTWYGDHVPSMPDVYQVLDFTDAHTDYFIWQNQPLSNGYSANPSNSSNSCALDISQLAMSLLKQAQLPLPAPLPSSLS